MIVLIPAYQSDGRLPDVVASLLSAAPGIRLVVVDDGSGPRHAHQFDVVRTMGCQVLEHAVNRGKGAALRTGFAFVARNWPGEDVVCADSDGQHRAVDVLRVADRVRSRDAVVLGARRFTGVVPARSRVGNAAPRVLFRLATGRRLQDTQTGLRGHPATMLPWLLSVAGDRFEYELVVLLQAARRGLPIEEIEIATIYFEGNASSHFRPLVDSLRVYAPLLTFLLSSFSAFLVDTIALLALHALTGTLLLSVVGARAVSSGVNFLVNRRLVFGTAPDRRAPGAAAVRYGTLVVLLLGANYAVLSALTGGGLALLPAKLLTEGLLLAVSYLAQRLLVFRRPGRPVEGAPPGRDRTPGPLPVHDLPAEV
ncbi:MULTISPECIES: glycosyltransferase [unclassified Modestobacter]